MFPICGRSSIRALWSPYSGVWVEIFVFIFVLCAVVCGCLINQWSMEVFYWYICVYITGGYVC